MFFDGKHSQVLKLTEGLGCDVYIEATGHPEAVKQGFERVRDVEGC